jgi:hypothetical protein
MGPHCPEQLSQEETLEEVCVGPDPDSPQAAASNLLAGACGWPKGLLTTLEFLRIDGWTVSEWMVSIVLGWTLPGSVVDRPSTREAMSSPRAYEIEREQYP